MKLRCLFAVVLITIFVCGCGPSGSFDSSGSEIPEDTRDYRAEIEALKNVEKKENSTDAYAASLNESLQAEEPAGALEGGRSRIFLGASRACYFKKHLMDSLDKNWDELAYVTDAGEKGQERFGQDGRDFLQNIGPVAGSDHCIVLGNEIYVSKGQDGGQAESQDEGQVDSQSGNPAENQGEGQPESQSAGSAGDGIQDETQTNSQADSQDGEQVKTQPRYLLTEIDEAGEEVREIPLRFPGGDAMSGEEIDEAVAGISRLAMDGSGRVHLTRKTEEGWQYWILSTEGEVLAEDTLREGDILELVPIYGGLVAFWTGSEEDYEIWKLIGGDEPMETALRYLDPETGKTEELGALEKGVYCWTLVDKKTLFYADREGVFRRDLSGKAPEPLYLWVNHGIVMKDVYAMQAEGAEKIRLLYEDGEDGCHYLCLEPAAEEESGVCEITLAVSPNNSDLLIQAAVKFNKKYPGCHIKIKNNYEETALLTELTAGKGPVVVDTALTGFVDQKELWEPLDSFAKQMGITEALWPAALEAGKIDGVQCGLPISCIMEGLGTLDPDVEDWDYDTFLQLVEQTAENQQDFEGVFNSYEGYGTHFITDFFIHGVEDSYFWDAEKGTTDFDSEKFRRVLKIAKEYVEDKGRIGADYDKVLEGKLFCFEFWINDILEFMSDKAAFGGKMYYIGYPTRDGAANELHVGNPLSIRKTASDEEKLAAYAFLDYCVSSEIQKGIISEYFTPYPSMSVRKDLLEVQLEALKVSAEKHQHAVVSNGRSIPILDYIDIEQDSKILYEMFENAKPRNELPRELLEILEGELGQYFAGTITEDMLIDHLENRVGLYLEERK